MGPQPAFALVAASLIVLGTTPLLRRKALAIGFVDRPAPHKSHTSPTPYLGGVGLVLAVLVGAMFAWPPTRSVEVVVLGGPVIGCLGLLDDRWTVPVHVRLAAEIGLAAAAVAAGLRIHATDLRLIDDAITAAWIVGMTNAINLVDNMDGLAASVSAVASVAMLALAVAGERPGTAVLAASLAGAAMGFMAYNKPPALIFMGDAGSLFLGFVLAVCSIDIASDLESPAAFVIPLMLLALPVVDTTVVTVGRVRRGRSIFQGGRDHLSHRLVARGMSAGRAVAALVGVEIFVAMLAVLAGRGVVAIAVAGAAATAVLAGLITFTMGVAVYDEPVVGLPPT